MVLDNANITNCKPSEWHNISSAVHTAQLFVKRALNPVDRFKEMVQKGIKIVYIFIASIQPHSRFNVKTETVLLT